MWDLLDLRQLRHGSSLRRLVTIAALGLLPAACGRSCGCVEGEKTYETLNGKVKVSLVRKVRWVGGKIPGPETTFHLHVETNPPFDEPIRDCDHVDLAEDDVGKNIGFRCKDGKDGGKWHVLRLRGGDRRIRECNAPVALVGVSRKPEWKTLEPIRKSAERVLDCPDGDVYYATGELTRAIAEDEGEASAIDFVSTTLASRNVPDRSTYVIDPWDRGLFALSPDARSKALAALCQSLDPHDPPPTSERYLRAVMRCAFDGSNASNVGRGALAMFGSILRASQSTATPRNSTTESVLYWSAILAAEKLPSETGAIACSEAHRIGPHEERAAIVAAVIAHTKTRCKEVEGWLADSPRCSSNVDCNDGGLCSETDLSHDTESWKEALPANSDGGLRTEPYRPNADRAVLRATYVQGIPLPKSFVLGNARRHYELADEVDGGSYCTDDTLDAGARCRCASLPEYERCKIPADGGAPASRVRYEYCSLRVDDVHKRFDDIRRVCENEGAHCDYSALNCCGGLKCEAIVGGSGGICKPIAPPTGRRDN